jgi:hypothetical protein
MSQDATDAIVRTDRFEYRGKRYEVPIFDARDPVILRPCSPAPTVSVPAADPVIQSLNTVWDLARFQTVHRPVSVGVLSPEEVAPFAAPGLTRVLDMPIKFPDLAEYRVPRALAQLAGVLQRMVDFEHAVNPRHDEYFAYLTVDQRSVAPGTLHREAPCHVDGFQGARWSPKCLLNHTYTVSDVLPTAYYPQPFDFTGLDERVHDFFWEMNAQVADTAEAHRWQPRPAEITLMNAYCVHRGVENDGPAAMRRTWVRLSFEERRRVFDRLGNGHNPLFEYAWEMVERDIEQLHLRPFRLGDPSLSVFPWQDLDGKPLPPGHAKTKPRLRPDGRARSR